jgi:hypothetical protein
MKSNRSGSAWFRIALRFVPLLLLPAMVGCGVGQGKVSGKVMFEGKPLPGGRVTFFPQEKGLNDVTVLLDEQGNYQVDLPACEVKVTVNNQELKPRHRLSFGGVPPGIPGQAIQKLKQAPKQEAKGTIDPGMRGRIPGKYVEIPAKFADLSTTPLSFTVHRGDQLHNIELTK